MSRDGKQADKAIEAKNIELSNPLGVSSVYANDFGMGFTLTDVRFIFAEVGADATTPSKVLRANVVIPLELAEAIATHLLKSLEQHKKTLEGIKANARSAAKSV